MKQLGAAEGYDFNRTLIGELGFIRRHLRYPISRRTSLPVIILLASVPGFLILGWIMLFNRPNSSASTAAFIPVLFCCMMLPGIVAAVRFTRTLRFKAVAARPDQASNMALLERFLRTHQFAYARHPEAPEVFSIMSTPIAALRQEREVVIFIADPGRILVNSHFTQNNFRAATGKVHYMELARKLASWLREQQNQNAPALQRMD
jgi:hypothetical protein